MNDVRSEWVVRRQWKRSISKFATISDPKKTRLTQWHSGGENDGGDNQRNDGIEVVLERPRRLPDDKTSGDYTDVSQSIPEHVQQDSLHIH